MSAWAWLGLSAIAATLLWLMGVLFTTRLQHRFIFRPIRLPQDYRYRFDTPHEELWFDRPDGARLNALRFPAKGHSKGVVLYCHGNAGALDKWGQVHPTFTSRGWDLLVWDYRGYGKSTGRRSEAAMLGDAVAMAKHLHAEVGSARLVIYGRSIGSAMACAAAEAVPCRNLLLETPFHSMRDLFFTYYPFLPRVFPFAYVFDNRMRLARVEAPVVIFQGTRDYVVPHRCAARLRAALKPSDAFHTLPGAGHSDVGRYAEYHAALDEILGRAEF